MYTVLQETATLMQRACHGHKQVGRCCRATHRLKDEHAIVRAQQLGDQELEELFLDPTSIDAILPNEVHPQGLEDIPGLLPGYLI